MESLPDALGAMTSFYLVVFVFTILAFAGFSATVANAKGHSSFQWFFLGLLFGFIALIASCGLPIKEQRVILYPYDQRPVGACPYCKELIFQDAQTCKHCHKEVRQ